MGSTNFDRMPYRVYASKRIVHEDYNVKLYLNDVALLRLPSSPTGPGIGIVELAPENMDSLEGKIVRASGFGAISNGGKMSQDLLKVNLRVISNEECQKAYNQTNAIQPSNICTTWFTQQGQSVCDGDSGGPLIHKVDGRDVLVGVASFGSKKGCDTAPTAFARVSSYRKWIDATIGNHS